MFIASTTATIRHFSPPLASAGLFVSCLLCIFAVMVTPARAQQVCINEFFADGAANFPDWIELRNCGEKPLDLKGYFLSDNIKAPKWKIRSHFVLAPGQLKAFICDGKDRHDHTNFRLSAGGGDVAIFAPDGTLVDSFSYTRLPRLHSVGRAHPSDSAAQKDGATWYYFSEPTRGRHNTGSKQRVIQESSATPPPRLSHAAGRYPGPFTAVLATGNREHVHYTLDGSEPTQKSPLFPKQYTVKRNSVLRLRTIPPQGQSSPVASYSYFIAPDTALPIVSVVTAPSNLWDPETGIFVDGQDVESGRKARPNWSYNWRRPVHVDFIESPARYAQMHSPRSAPSPLSAVTSQQGSFSATGEFRVYGGASRKRVQKSMAFFFGTDAVPYPITYPLFPSEPHLTRLAGFALRNGGDWWLKNQIIDGFGHTVAAGRMRVGRMAYRPVRVYINGTYWGLMGLRNRFNRRSILAEENLPLQKIDEVEGTLISTSPDGPWKGVMEAFTESGSYKKALVGWQIDSFMDYLCLEIFANNTDWLAGNIMAWRPRENDRKWRWFAYDLDYGFGGKRGWKFNTLQWATNHQWSSTIKLAMLRQDPQFVNDFTSRMAVHLLTTFAPSRTLPILEDIISTVEPEMPHQIKRWIWKRPRASMKKWYNSLERIRDFCKHRPAAVLAMFQSHYNTGPPTPTRLDFGSPEGGTVEVCGVTMHAPVLEGPIPQKVMLAVHAIPHEGYRFIGWKNGDTSPSLSIPAGSSLQLHPVFEKSAEENR